MTIIKNLLRAATSCVAATVCCAAQAADGEGWDWKVAPYVWAPSISADLDTAVPPTGTDTDFSDIIDKIDGAFLMHVEGQGDTFGMFGDVVYLSLGDDKDHPRYRTNSDLDAMLFEVAAVWNPGERRFRGAEVFAGLRYLDIDLTVRIDPANPIFDTATLDAGASYADFLIGVRYSWDMSERWGIAVRGDGSFGETDGTWSASAIASYRMKRGEWVMGYRHMDIALEPRQNRAELILSGVIIGYGFHF